MNYVVQNYSANIFTCTPRILNTITLKNLHLTLFLFKINFLQTSFINAELWQTLSINNFKQFQKFNFYTYILKITNKQQTFYLTTFQNSLNYWLLKSCVYFFDNHLTKNCTLYPTNHNLSKSYLVTQQTTNIRINNTLFQKLFIFLLTIHHQFWYSGSVTYQLPTNFLFTHPVLLLNIFYGGFFFNIYKF